MAGIMFQDVVSPRAGVTRKWYAVPLSFLVHTSMLTVLIIVPLIATDVLPQPRELMQFTTPFVPVLPSPPPVRRAPVARASASAASAAPVVAPQTIGVASGVIVDQSAVDTGSIDSIPGAIDPGLVAVDPVPVIPAVPATRVRIGGIIKAPVRTRYVPPQYPDIARSARVEGLVIIEAVIGTDGRVEDARVLRSKALLDEAALAAVRSWEYTPTLLNGMPTRVVMTVTVQFNLN